MRTPKPVVWEPHVRSKLDARLHAWAQRAPARATRQAAWQSRFSQPLSVAQTSKAIGIVDFLRTPAKVGVVMSDVILVLLRSLLSGCQSRCLLLLENLALRHQFTVLRRRTRKPKLGQADRLLWLALRRWWPDSQRALALVQPQTLIAWHRLGLRLFWRWKSRARGGRPAADRKLIQLIRRMWSSNPTWGSKRIQAELAKLGIAVSDSTIRKYRPRNRRGDQT